MSNPLSDYNNSIEIVVIDKDKREYELKTSNNIDVVNIVDRYIEKITINHNSFSAISNIVLLEQLLPRFIIDLFLTNITDKVKEPVTIRFIKNDKVHIISFANNQEELGGIVYNIID